MLGTRVVRRLRRDPRTSVIELVPPGGVCAELGVWKGDFAAKILRLARPSKLHLVDPWAFMPSAEYSEARYGGRDALDQGAMDELYEGVLRRFVAEIADGVVEVHRAESAAAADRFPDASFDWVYVDGNHLYDYVRADLNRYDPKIKVGGVLAGHDFDETGWWEDGVTRAVTEFVAERGYEVVSLRAHQFVLRKPG